MSEYIVKCKKFTSITGNELEFPEYIDKNQEIVRCRDCKHYDPNDAPSEVYPDRYWCDKLTVYMPEDGFCSFGERKVGE